MPASPRPIDQQVIVITGASSGIGLRTAQLAVERGARVVIAARSDETLDQIAADLSSGCDERRAIAVECDVADRAQVQRVANEAMRVFGRIDTWVNNAGISIYGRLDEVSEEDSRRLFDTNFWGLVNGSLVALPFLKQSQGVLINVGSEVSEAVAPLLGMYAASKHAVKGFNDALRLEIEEIDNAPVSIVLIQPTSTDTPFPQHARNYMDKDAKLPDPQQEPDKVAEAILDAAIKPQRAVKVGVMASLNVAVAKFLPGLGDKLAAGRVDDEQADRPAQDPAGALHRPSEESRSVGQVHGLPGRDKDRR